MGKMAGATGRGAARGGRLILKGRLKAGQLRFREGMKKGLKEDDRLAQAGIQVVMDRVEHFPIAIRMKGIPGGQLFRGGLKAGIKFIDQIGEGGNLVNELRFARQKDSAEEIIEESHALTAGILKILCLERSEIGDSAKMLGV